MVNLESLIKAEIKKKKAEYILREKLDIEKLITNIKDDKELRKLKKKIKKRKWEYWK